MYKLSKLIITVIAILSIFCFGSVAFSATDTTEPTTEATSSEQASEAPAEQQTDNHNAVCCILMSIGIPSGCMIAQGFSFWKW